MKTLSLKNLSELPQTAKAILEFAGEKKIFCFYGELGAGKTTLIKELCKQLGVTDKGSSPTFALVNEYKIPSPLPTSPIGGGEKTQVLPNGEDLGGASAVFHLDLYRLKSESEIYGIGYEDYLYSGNYCFIEWPEKMERLLPEDCLRVKIEVKNGERIISLS
ncbi:MAG: tRNA (adenosine(37)-N6)-threonylcarbamoyltransferase complex ATPase subunit type 1 TsaE [Bacteroidetes bacterium]|nr:tRNA (adenosine(37)-N6)-threonylcarbamoyltransferase complex ATPase subunit type 1 TsaE [Bacteroidota bacterium]